MEPDETTAPEESVREDIEASAEAEAEAETPEVPATVVSAELNAVADAGSAALEELGDAAEPETVDGAEVAHAGFLEAPEVKATEQLAGRIWSILPEVHVEIAASLAALDVRLPQAAVQTVQPPAPQGTVAVIPLRGVITPRGSFIARLFGFSAGLEGFREDLREAVNDDSVKAIIIDIDSPGGTVDMVPETAAEVFAARGTKPIVAVANTMCASAAYWIASQADELVITPSGQVGSIGVFTVHEDVSAAAQRMGIKVTVISAGKYKTEGNPYEPFSKQAAVATQSKCDDLYAMFTSDISRGRGVPVLAVQAGYGEGRCVLSGQALALKMVDRIETFESTVARLGGTLSSEEPEGSDDPCADDDDVDPDESPEATTTTTDPGRVSGPTVDYLSDGRRELPGWQIGASRPSVGGRL